MRYIFTPFPKGNRIICLAFFLLLTLTGFTPGQPEQSATAGLENATIRIAGPKLIPVVYPAITDVFNGNTASVTLQKINFAAPNQPTNPSPANAGNAANLSPQLCVSVSDPDANNLRVRFYGRTKPPANSTDKFTVIILPDTQYYTEQPQGSTDGGNNFMFKAQTDWIAANRAAMNIVYVGHLGDCVQNGDNPPGSDNDIEWRRVDTAMKKIENPVTTGLAQGIPYGMTVGNHDQQPNGSPTGTTTYYNQYFGEARFTGRSYYGGHRGANNDNHYQLFSASGIDFLVISMEYDQTAAFSAAGGTLDWAEDLVEANPNRKVIVMTHWGINESTTFGTQGQAIYNRLRNYPNFMLYACGHIHSSDGEARRSDTFNGNTVHTVLSDYQDRDGGGSGKLRIYEFDPAQNKISAKTYSPFNNTFETDADSQFELTTNLNVYPYALLGEVNNVTSGTTACINWNNIAETTNFEWYAEVFDGTTTTTGPVWSFTTPASAPLPVSLINFAASEVPGNKAKLSWSTTFEQDMSHFEIQRSADGAVFTTIANVTAKGNSGNLLNYATYDNDPLPGTNYYRLKLVETDGSFKHSTIVSVSLSESANAVRIYPNPSETRSFTVRFGSTIRGKVQVKLYDLSGRLLFAKQETVTNGRVLVQHNLPRNMYLVHITGEGINEKRKLLVGN